MKLFLIAQSQSADFIGTLLHSVHHTDAFLLHGELFALYSPQCLKCMACAICILVRLLLFKFYSAFYFHHCVHRWLLLW